MDDYLNDIRSIIIHHVNSVQSDELWNYAISDIEKHFKNFPNEDCGNLNDEKFKRYITQCYMLGAIRALYSITDKL